MRKLQTKSLTFNNKRSFYKLFQISFWHCLVDNKLVKWFFCLSILLNLLCFFSWKLAALSLSAHHVLQKKSAGRQCCAPQELQPFTTQLDSGQVNNLLQVKNDWCQLTLSLTLLSCYRIIQVDQISRHCS